MTGKDIDNELRKVVKLMIKVGQHEAIIFHKGYLAKCEIKKEEGD